MGDQSAVHCCSTKTSSSECCRAKWSKLETELIELILEKCVFIDILRFKAVCLSWNYAAKSYISAPYFNPMPQTPWLMLSSGQEQEADNKNTTARFFGLAEKKVYSYTTKNKVFVSPMNAWCVGSSHGWLVIMDRRTNSTHLFNPISEDRIELPFFRTDSRVFRFPLRPNTKAVLSSDPSRKNNFVVAIIHGPLVNKTLAFCKHGSKKWTKLHSATEPKRYHDVIFHNDQLYALDYDLSIEVWDFSKSFHIKTMHLQPSHFTDRCRSFTYLVESLGEFFLVKWLTPKGDYEFWSLRYGGSFLIYKLNLTKNRWMEVKCLGNRVLFVGTNQSMSVSTEDFPECEENSIYFTNYRCGGSNVDGHDNGVYSLKDKVMKPCYQRGRERESRHSSDRSPMRGVGERTFPPVWIVPNPRCKQYTAV